MCQGGIAQTWDQDEPGSFIFTTSTDAFCWANPKWANDGFAGIRKPLDAPFLAG
jgi:hypothetical protein